MIVALGAFWQDVLANVIAGGVVLLAGAFVIERILEHRDRIHEREERREERRLEARRADLRRKTAELKRKGAALRSVALELEWNQGQLNDLREAIGQGKTEVTNVLFTTHGWDLIRQETILTTLRPDTIEDLFAVYRMFHVVNDLHTVVFDHFHGATATAIEFEAILQSRLTYIQTRYEREKRWYLQQLEASLDGLQAEGLIGAAIERVGSELKRVGSELKDVDSELERVDSKLGIEEALAVPSDTA